METEMDLLHNDMLSVLSRCLELEHPEKENVESCFWIAQNYWKHLQDIVKLNSFKDEGSEIYFYREVKPKFASYIEYFSLLSEGLMFEPPWIPCPDDLEVKIDEADWRKAWQNSVIKYWTLEENRGLRFYEKNREFIEYCEAGQTENDQNYFLVRNSTVRQISQRRSHNRDSELFTVYEEILTTWKAYKLYSEYIKMKVDEQISPREALSNKSADQ